MSRETVRSTSPRLFLLPLSTLLSHPGKPLSSLKALLAAHPDLETGTCCRLVDTSCNNTLKTTASGHWVLTSAGALEMTPHLQKRPRAGHQEQNRHSQSKFKEVNSRQNVLLRWQFCLSTRKAIIRERQMDISTKYHSEREGEDETSKEEPCRL